MRFLTDGVRLRTAAGEIQLDPVGIFGIAHRFKQRGLVFFHRKTSYADDQEGTGRIRCRFLGTQIDIRDDPVGDQVETRLEIEFLQPFEDVFRRALDIGAIIENRIAPDAQ